MQRQNSVFGPAERLRVEYTDKPVSGWGGLVAVARYFERRGLRELLRRALPDGRTSPNQIPVVDMVLAFLIAVLTGARRFAHVERLRSDEVVKAILGVVRMPSAMTLTRYLGGFVRSQVEHLSEVLWQFTVERLRTPALGMVLDLDSTVFERYGKQEGSLKGHNPRKHGRPSHHPLLAMLAEGKVVLHAWLRSGNAGTARGVKAFLDEALARLPRAVRLYALRADAGFFIREFFEDLEGRGLCYAIAARMTPHLHREVVGLRHWSEFAPGLAAAEVMYQAPSWTKARRVVVVREEERERPDARGRRLIEVPGYTFHAVATTLEHAAVDVWRFYNGRADCENRIKELKEDFAANGFCLQSFDGTEAAFRLICFLFNLMAEFKREVTRDETPRLMTVRSQWLVVGAVLGADGRQRVLRLGLRANWRERFEALLQRLASLWSSTVSQLPIVWESLGESPRPWQPRRSRRRPGPLVRLGWAFS